MKILKKLVKKATDMSEGLYVEDFVIGIGLVGVKLSNGSAGVAYNLRQDLLGQCEEFSKGRGKDYSLLLKPGEKATTFIEAFISENPIAKSLGLATINTVLSEKDNLQKGDILEYLEIKEGDVVGMIGEIGPLIMSAMEKGASVRVFERNRKRGQFPDWAITTHLEDCDVVIISASSIVNWTIEWILDYVNTDRVAIVGPTATLVKDVFPVKVIAGTNILDPDRLLEALSRGIGTTGLYSSGIAEKVDLVLT
ncbi:MAG: DUF364 domain-containing protein [Thermotogaceae bacterium]|nr:DUF364 domain-containing protein [Thermotogaceae bacterium]